MAAQGAMDENELQKMTEGPEKIVRHRRSISQPVDGFPINEQEQWFAGAEAQGMGMPGSAGAAGGRGIPPKVDRKGAHRPPATAALAALVNGAPYIGPDAAEAAMLDPKRAKRILANRQSAARSKERKLRYIGELEKKVSTLQGQVKDAELEYKQMQEETKVLTAEKEKLEQQLQCVEKQVADQEELNQHLQSEVQRVAQAPPADVSASSMDSVLPQAQSGSSDPASQ